MITKQVCFRGMGEDSYQGGILVDDKYVICGCCGGVYEMDEIDEIEPYGEWIDISDDIMARV